MVELMVLWSQPFFGESVARVAPQKSVAELRIPVLIIHSEDDNQIPFKHALRLKESLKENKRAEFYFLKGKLHGDLPREFDLRLKDFFIRSL